MIQDRPAKVPATPSTGGFLSDRTWRTTNRVTGRVLLYLVLALGLVIFVAPMYWLAASSLKPEGDVFEYPPNFLPSQVLWSNYPEAIASFPLVNSVKNSAFIIVTVELGRAAHRQHGRLRFRASTLSLQGQAIPPGLEHDDDSLPRDSGSSVPDIPRSEPA